jgi:hypothetical protein
MQQKSQIKTYSPDLRKKLCSSESLKRFFLFLSFKLFMLKIFKYTKFCQKRKMFKIFPLFIEENAKKILLQNIKG